MKVSGHSEKVKPTLHKRSKHHGRYNLDDLAKALPRLQAFMGTNKYGDLSIDFFDPAAVKALNRALLKRYYGVKYWDVPSGYLCPPIPGRAEYIHNVADLLSDSQQITHAKVPRGSNVRCLDIGVGANCIYPLIGQSEYGWSFVGSDIDDVALFNAEEIVGKNPKISNSIEIRRQANQDLILKGIARENEQFDLCICNPPFHSSQKEALSGTQRKLKNLKGQQVEDPILNFGGQNNELWCTGGEVAFIGKLIEESQLYAKQILWFTTLVSKESNLEGLTIKLASTQAEEVKVLPILLGNKKSRILAWTYLSKSQQKAWAKYKWKL